LLRGGKTWMPGTRPGKTTLLRITRRKDSIAKGADLNRMMTEPQGRQTGYCKAQRRLDAHR